MRRFLSFVFVLVMIFITAPSTQAQAPKPPTTADLTKKIHELEKRIQVLEAALATKKTSDAKVTPHPLDELFAETALQGSWEWRPKFKYEGLGRSIDGRFVPWSERDYYIWVPNPKKK